MHKHANAYKCIQVHAFAGKTNTKTNTKTNIKTNTKTNVKTNIKTNVNYVNIHSYTK